MRPSQPPHFQVLLRSNGQRLGAQDWRRGRALFVPKSNDNGQVQRSPGHPLQYPISCRNRMPVFIFRMNLILEHVDLWRLRSSSYVALCGAARRANHST